ncbi:MAG: protein kinase [Planctomycetes bacterium]|nr:protein kinase [Planctomycetota bacterium]
MAEQTLLVSRRAPDFDFELTSGTPQSRQRVTLADYQDRWLILLFYPHDFTLICPTELTAVSARIDEFHKRGCDIIGISTDAIETHERWLSLPRGQGGLGGLNFPLAADEDGETARAYGVLIPRQNAALRGLFLIDPNGVMQYQVVHNLSVGRSTEEVLRVLDGIQSGGLCPAEWTPEQPVMDIGGTLGPHSLVGQYRIEAMIGTGAFGTVFRAEDVTLQRRVALKILQNERAGSMDALLAEARLAAALNHPNVCIVHAVDGTQGFPMVVMEYIDGRALNKLLENGRMPLEQTVAIGQQIALGMAAAHEQGIVHGDLKPANIMVTEDEVVKIMDFGLARRHKKQKVDETVVEMEKTSGSLSGTPGYMSPEQARGGRPIPASDVFSLGLILYEMSAGRKAVTGQSLLEALRQIDQIHGERMADGLPEPIGGILRRALVQETDRRTVTMCEISELLTL